MKPRIILTFVFGIWLTIVCQAADDSPDIVVTISGMRTPIPSPTQAGTAILVQASGETSRTTEGG